MNNFIPMKKANTCDKVVISIRLAESRLHKIDKLSIENDISRNEFINQCIDFALSNLGPSDIKNDKKRSKSKTLRTKI